MLDLDRDRDRDRDIPATAAAQRSHWQLRAFAGATTGTAREEGSVVVTKESTMNRLETIATRQRKSFVRDIVFAALVVVAGIVSLESVVTAAHAAEIARR